MPDISVIIPTRNRSAFLGACLSSLCQQTIDPARYDICVVNNGSTDTTPQIVADIARKYPAHKIFMVDEPVVGLSVARNTGVRETTSPLVCMGDDDATMPSNWIEQFLTHFAHIGPSLAKVAGEIVPVWQAPRPDWMTDNMLPLLSAASGLGPVARFSDDPLMEGNSCYRREALLQAGGFPTQLGRKGNHLLSSDQLVDIMIHLKGWKMYFDPAIVIHHTIHADRLTPAWMRRRYFWQGVSDYIGRVYLKQMNVSINYGLSIELPLNMADWSYVNNATLPPTESELYRIRSLGLVLAMSGLIPIEGFTG